MDDDDISIDVLTLNSDEDINDDDDQTTEDLSDGSSLYKLLKPKLNAKITNNKVQL